MKTIITDQQKADIIRLSIEGKTNREIETTLLMKKATLLYWKKQLRLSGIDLPAVLGRPSGVPTEAELERAKKILAYPQKR